MEIAVIISTIIGPVLGVMLAHIMSSKHSTLHEAMKLITKTFEDAQLFRHASLDFLKSAIIYIPTEALSTLRQNRTLEAKLNADGMAIELLVGKKAGKVKQTLRDLFDVSSSLPPLFESSLQMSRDEAESIIDEATKNYELQLNRLFTALMDLKDSIGSDDL